ncbi:MAG: hypothetical protein HQL52_15250 [Magnetococcales bacterium]|nr:hypothetical protein [Magnetococcales bacterium]
MRFSLALVMVLALFFSGEVEAREVYKSGRFTVRKVEGTCKLEVALPLSGQDTAAILALFPTDDYYGEFFTERRRIGMARDKLKISFDRGENQEVGFVPDSSAKDSYWRWQYLENTQGLLEKIRKMDRMEISFSNGKKNFKFKVSLKGSSKAVKALQKCR